MSILLSCKQICWRLYRRNYTSIRYVCIALLTFRQVGFHVATIIERIDDVHTALLMLR
jgi:hypothetical protein